MALVFVAAVKIWILPLFSSSAPTKAVSTSPAEQQEIVAFEQGRLRDSLARVEKWAAERKARQWAREERERAYQAQHRPMGSGESCTRGTACGATSTLRQPSAQPSAKARQRGATGC